MTEADVLRFIYHEARLLDEARWEAWYDLFTEDGFYWVPLVHGQKDGINHTSLAYEDRLLLKLRVERLKSRPFSQHPPSRSQHVLQMPQIERQDGDLWQTRTAFHYTEARGDDQQMYAGLVWHDLVAGPTGLRIRLKRVDLLNCEAALPSIQLFF